MNFNISDMTTKSRIAFRRPLPFGPFLIAVMLLAGGCSEYDETAGEQTAVRFKAGIAAATRTADGGDAWSVNDAVGIYMTRHGGQLASASDIKADNVRHTVTDAATGALAGAQTIYYPADNSSSVDFIAYYPYSETGVAADCKYAVSVTDQSRPETIDLLYAKAENKKRTSGTVALEFGHVMSKVTFNVMHGTGLDAADIAEASASIEGMPASATLDLQDGTLTAGSVENGIGLRKAPVAGKGYDATFSAIIVPQEKAGGRRVVLVTKDGVRYEGTLPDSDVFEKGNHYTYTVTVDETGISFGALSVGRWLIRENNTGGTTRIGMETVFIKAGTFLMGSPDDESGHQENEKLHQVTLTRDFYMGKYEVTNAQYAEFLNAEGIEGPYGSCIVAGDLVPVITEHEWGLKYDIYNFRWKPQDGKDNFPVPNVTWYGAKAFADWIGGSLPTNAQWEYACRAGTTTAYFFGDDRSDLDKYAWTVSNSEWKTHEVGALAPNPWGLYDIYGNVYEWCLDGWAGCEDAVDPVGPVRPVGSGSDVRDVRSLRGGGWSYGPNNSRSASFKEDSPASDYYWGFRVVFVL